MSEKKVLVLHYSQTGQLTNIVESFLSGFTAAEIMVEQVFIQPKNDFPFPWKSDSFFATMPDSVLLKGCEIVLPEFTSKKYDLVVLAYQPWFLSPSIPVTGALLHSNVQAVLQNTPVVTIIGARNMWLNAQQKIKHLLKQANAVLVGNIALVDKAPNLISVLTVMRWMFKGKKEATKWLPASGVSNQDIAQMKIFGIIVQQHLMNRNLLNLQQAIIQNKGVEVDENLMFVEQRAGKLFAIWANFINKKSNKTFWSSVFKWYLIIAIFVVAPIVLSVYSLIFKPFLFKSIHKQKDYYLNVN